MDGIELSEVCSLSFFRATPLTEFRQKLNGCLKSNVRSFPSLKSPTSTTVTGNCIDDVTVTVTVTNHVSSGGGEGMNRVARYDRWKITTLLTSEIDWKALCENHDNQHLKHRDPQANHTTNHTTNTTTTTTALWEIVTAATNPVVVPQCCHGRCLVDVLLNALLLSPSFSASLRQQQERQRQRQRQRRQNNNHTQQQNISATAAAVVASRWTPSQQFLLETIQRLLASAGMASTVAATDSVMTKFVGRFVVQKPLSLPTTMRDAVTATTTATATATASISNAATTSTNTETNTETKTNTTTTGMTPNKVNRLLSAIYWLLNQSSLPLPLPLPLQSLPSPLTLVEMELISAGLLLLERIDDWDIQLAVVESEEQSTTNANANAKTKKERGLGLDRCPVCSGILIDNNNNHDDGDGTDGWNNRSRRTKKMTTANLSNLHDEELEPGKNTTQTLHNNSNNNNNNSSSLFWRRGYQTKPKKVSLKDVLSMKEKSESSYNNSNNNNNKFGGKRPCHCTNNIGESLQRRKRKRSGLTTTTAISPDWSTVRSRAYKKFVSIAVERQRQHQRQRQRLRNTIPNATAISEETFLWFLVRDAAIHAESPSRRVCLALVAHSLGGPKNPYYFQMIAGLFWRGYCSSLRQPRAESSVTAYASAAASTWLRLYSEWLGECAVFDQREVLWEAIQPIVECVTTAITMRPKNDDGDGRHNDSVKQNHDACNHESERKEKHAGVNNEVDPALLACIGYILHRRFSMFQSRKKPSENHHQNSASNVRIEEGFRSFINVLSIHGGESSEPWLDLFSDSTGDYVESTLQRLGILSFSLSVAGEESSTRTDTRIIRHCDPEHFKTLDSLATEDWPFSKEFGTRNAMGRIEQSVLCLEHGNEAVVSLLVRPVKGGNGPSRKPKEPKKLKARVSSVPMMNYLHDSGILCMIFSFCSSKQLVRIPQVCKTWKATSDMVSNDLWENAYVADFGKYRWACRDAKHRHLAASRVVCEHQDRNNVVEAADRTDWKDIFIRKHIADKLIRFQRNPRTGFKHRTCSYLGCLQILKSTGQERRHDQMHERFLAKQQQRSKKKRASRRKKDG